MIYLILANIIMVLFIISLIVGVLGGFFRLMAYLEDDIIKESKELPKYQLQNSYKG